MNSLEERLMRNARTVLRDVLDGRSSPDAALEKQARRDGMGDDMLRTVGTMVNQALSARMTPQGRHEFDLADVEKVAARMRDVVEVEKAAERPAFRLPTRSCATADFPKVAVQARAAEPLDDRFARRFRMASNECLERHAALLKEANRREMAARVALDREVATLASQTRRMPDKALHKFAQLAVNGYQEVGKSMLRMVEALGGGGIPSLEKTANAAVFPSSPEYVQLARVVEAGIAYKRSQDVADLMHKYAEDVGDWTTRADAVAGDILYGRDRRLTDASTLEQELDPEIRNMLKEIDARNDLSRLILYDRDLREFPMPTLVAAYNSSVGAAPDLQGNPTALKALMLQRANSGNIVDVPQLAQEMKIGAESRKRLEGLQKRLDTGKALAKSDDAPSPLGPLAMAAAPGKRVTEWISGKDGKAKSGGDKAKDGGKDAGKDGKAKGGEPDMKGASEFVAKNRGKFMVEWEKAYLKANNAKTPFSDEDYNKALKVPFLRDVAARFMAGEKQPDDLSIAVEDMLTNLPESKSQQGGGQQGGGQQGGGKGGGQGSP
jgi:hypothetical protein